MEKRCKNTKRKNKQNAQNKSGRPIDQPNDWSARKNCFAHPPSLPPFYRLPCRLVSFSRVYLGILCIVVLGPQMAGCSALSSPTHPLLFFCLICFVFRPFHASFFLGSLCISPFSALLVKCRLFLLYLVLFSSRASWLRAWFGYWLYILVVHWFGSGLSSYPVGIRMIRDSATHGLCTSKSISQDL